MLAMKNLHHQCTGVVAGTDEAYSHHESSHAVTIQEAHIQAVIEFMEEKGSPLSDQTPCILHNFVTKEVMTEDIRNDVLNAFVRGKEKYLSFRPTRFIQKSIRLSESIHRTNLKTMDAIRHKSQKTIKKTVREMNIVEKTIKIAHDRAFTTEVNTSVI